MKRYTFTIEVEEINLTGSFANDLINELDDEKRQMIITRKVNKKTMETHAEILKELVDNLNSQMVGLGCKFEIDQCSLQGGYNGYQHQTAILKLGSFCFSRGIRITGEYDNSFKDSKYTTYTGEYRLQQTILSSPCWSASTDWYDISETRVLDLFKNDIKEFYKLNNK